jgi:hypothetical protein
MPQTEAEYILVVAIYPKYVSVYKVPKTIPYADN